MEDKNKHRCVFSANTKTYNCTELKQIVFHKRLLFSLRATEKMVSPKITSKMCTDLNISMVFDVELI